jgi:hypothetical protein
MDDLCAGLWGAGLAPVLVYFRLATEPGRASGFIA